MNKCIVFLLLFHIVPCFSVVFSQEKFEKESRLNVAQVPVDALTFLKKLNIESKIKWFREESLTETSIEAKFKFKGNRYSVEFDSIGKIQDIELEQHLKSVAPGVQLKMQSVLAKDCSRFKINKVQIQYSGTSQHLIDFFLSGKVSENVQIRYEVVTRCKENKEVSLYEYLFDNLGQFIKRSKIVFKNSSHLEY